MSLLFRQIFKNYARLMLILLAGICILFLLVEGPSRAQNLAAATDNLPKALLIYFGARIPSVIAVYLPVCCLIAGVVLLCASRREREIIALNSGGVSYAKVVFLLLICGIFWSAAQFFLEQNLGLRGDAFASAYYAQQRGLGTPSRQAHNIWFTDGPWLVHLDLINQDGSGQGFWAVNNPAQGQGPQEMLHAATFQGQAGNWTLFDAQSSRPSSFERVTEPMLNLPLGQSPQVFFVATEARPDNLPWRLLLDSIRQLQGAGTDTAPFQTALHQNFAYAALGATFTLVAAAIVSVSFNLYLALFMAITLALGGISLNSGLLDLGSAGVLPPALAAWLAPCLLAFLAGLRLIWNHFRR